MLMPNAEQTALHGTGSAVAPLTVTGLSVAYDRKLALDNIDFIAPAHSLSAIIGPNGAGKSTLIKAILGLVPVLKGDIEVFGQPIERQRKKVSYVPQRASVDWDFPTSVLDVVAMGLYGRIGWLRPVRRRHKEQALACLEKVGMAEFAHHQIGQLSGGQQQRVFLARALAQDAELYLMDEPFAGVDAATEKAILDVLNRLKTEGKTVICVHHDLQTVRDYFDHVLALNVRKIADGRADEVMTPEILQKAYGGRLLIGTDNG